MNLNFQSIEPSLGGYFESEPIFFISRKLIIFLVSISVLFILCGSIMLGAYFLCEAEYKHVQPVIVIGELVRRITILLIDKLHKPGV